MDFCQRTRMLVGDEGVERLRAARAAVFGIGGVGGYVAEALVRAGVGAIDLIDFDKVDVTNINRQIIALHSTVGMYKTDAAKQRLSDINPECSITTHNIMYLPDTADMLDLSAFDCIADAIDNVTGKLTIIERAQEAGVPVISCMGTGNKLDPTRFEAADIYDTSVCPLARVMRYECRKRGIKHLRVVYSKETPAVPLTDGRPVPASISFVPGAAGLIIAGEMIRTILNGK
ncbi:MAG: tRNA threonylcarbamoyladenosine dehydratase [Oscillospiraceae bacterium]|nr:tRNA threonylcarbamoyladenosine dehydratase [Oscillospiraceae bacterium]